ncbi:MAG: hypothetical protein JWQ87_4961 [Candidatus Sulfotelmatobacter sp.]|nr:hypothetical protein [Candidatus Sulfotelmatobacter sp.]
MSAIAGSSQSSVHSSVPSKPELVATPMIPVKQIGQDLLRLPFIMIPRIRLSVESSQAASKVKNDETYRTI